MIYRTVRRFGERARISISWMCRECGVSRSGYYAYAARKSQPSPKESRDYEDYLAVKYVYDYRGRPKGSRTISMMMPRLIEGKSMCRKKVRRLMRKYGLECPVRRANPMRRMMRAMQTHSVFSNKLNRQFAIGRPGEHLLTDISYLHYGPHGERRCYLSAMKDASTNEIVAWTLSETLEMPFVMEMLGKLDETEWLPANVLIHSDQGCHYTSYEYRRHLAEKGISQSMSRRGNCWDNAPMESFFGHAKDELHLRRCPTFADVKAEIDDYIDYYNNDRPQANLGRMTPTEFRDYLLAKPTTLPAIIEQAAKNDGAGPGSIIIQ